MVRGDGVEAGRLRKNGFFTQLLPRVRRATRRVERRRDSTQSQRSSHKRGDSISGGSGIDFVKAGQRLSNPATCASTEMSAANHRRPRTRRPPPRIPPWRAHPRPWKVTRSKTTKAYRRSRGRLSEVVRDRRRATARRALIKLFSLKWGTNLGREVVVNKPLI